MVYVMAGIFTTPSFVSFRNLSAYPRKSPSNRHATYHQTLAARQICTELAVYHDFANAQARVLQPFPATVPSLQNTCFFARPDSDIVTILSDNDKLFSFIGTLPPWELYHPKTNPAFLTGLWLLENFQLTGQLLFLNRL